MAEIAPVTGWLAQKKDLCLLFRISVDLWDRVFELKPPLVFEREFKGKKGMEDAKEKTAYNILEEKRVVIRALVQGAQYGVESKREAQLSLEAQERASRAEEEARRAAAKKAIKFGSFVSFSNI